MNRWDERFSAKEYAYGLEPNRFLQDQIKDINPGKALFPAEGEGRNAVFAAKQGWQVSAFDMSEEGRKKAMKLAESNQVEIDYRLGILDTLGYKPDQFDLIALIFAHFLAEIKSDYHKSLSTYLRKGGMVIFEAFSKNHLAYNSNGEKIGGPKELDMLFSVDEIRNDFPDYDVKILEEKVIELHEGEFHDGIGSVIRFVGQRNNSIMPLQILFWMLKYHQK